MKWLSAVALAFLTGAVAAQPIDRSELVRTAYRHLPQLLTYVEQLPEIQGWRDHDRWLLARISHLAKMDIPLEFSDDRAIFHDVEGSKDERLMVSTAIQDTVAGVNLDNGKIEVNRPLLNSMPEFDFAILLKQLIHELAWKTSDHDEAVRDRVGQFIENHLAPYIKTKNLDAQTRLIVLSLPINKLEKNLGEAEEGRPQPTIVVVLESGGYFDITENIMSNMGRSNVLLHSIFAQVFPLLFKIMGTVGEGADMMRSALSDTLKHVMSKMMADLGGKGKIRPEDIRAKMNLGKFDEPIDMSTEQILGFEIHNVVAIPVRDGTRVEMRATYRATRTKKKQGLSFGIDDLDKLEEFPIGVVVGFTLPPGPLNVSALKVDVQPRATADYREVGKVFVLGGPAGWVREMRIKVKDKPQSAQLHCDFGAGYILVDNAGIAYDDDSGKWMVTFAFTEAFFAEHVDLVASSVLLNQERTVFLERLVNLDPREHPARPPLAHQSSNSIVPGSVGFWGRYGSDQRVFKTDFIRGQPIAMHDGFYMADHFALDHSLFVADLIVKGPQEFRQARLHLKRTLTLVDVAPDPNQQTRPGKPPEEPGRITIERIDGQRYQMADHGNLKRWRDVQEVVSVDQAHIFTQRLKSGELGVRIEMGLPFKTIGKPESATQGHTPAIFTPVLLELVGDDNETLRYFFDEHMCEASLAGDSFKFTVDDVKFEPKFR